MIYFCGRPYHILLFTLSTERILGEIGTVTLLPPATSHTLYLWG